MVVNPLGDFLKTVEKQAEESTDALRKRGISITVDHESFERWRKLLESPPDKEVSQ